MKTMGIVTIWINMDIQYVNHLFLISTSFDSDCETNHPSHSTGQLPGTALIQIDPKLQRARFTWSGPISVS